MLLKLREDVLNSFKSNFFPKMSDATSRESFMDETSSKKGAVAKRNRNLNINS